MAERRVDSPRSAPVPVEQPRDSEPPRSSAFISRFLRREGTALSSPRTGPVGSPGAVKALEGSSEKDGGADAGAGPALDRRPRRTRDFGFLPVPRGCVPGEAFVFTKSLNWLMALGATLTVANLYVVQPILVELAGHFRVDYEQVTRIPSLLQGGYLVGLVLITPLGDLLPRRPLLLTLIVVAAFLALGQALAPDFKTFEGLSFLVGLASVPPQILVPLAADLAPPATRASCVSTVVSGLIGGMVVGRFFAGILTRYTGSPMHIFYFAFATQLALAVAFWWRLPAFPKKGLGLSYPQVLWSMVKLFCTKPALTQAALIGFCSTAVMVGWWVTLTFLLSDTPFSLNTFEIGLFGLAGIAAIVWAPLVGKVTDRIHPWVTTLVALLVQLCMQALAVGTARLSLAPVVICCIFVDICHQSSTIGNQRRFFDVDPHARSRVNGVYMAFTFLGQTTGSSVGPKLFLRHGWRAAYALNVAFIVAALGFLCARGPHAQGWIGWDGVWSLRRDPGKSRGASEREDKEKGELETADEVGQETAVEEGQRVELELDRGDVSARSKT
ncbi:hypothetical protein JCM9279_006823 [Rhodotorula babjevae]